MTRITIGIPTKSRQKSLARLLASLHGQSFRDFDLVIINDGVSDAVDKVGLWWLEKLVAEGRSVRVIHGARINQAYSHNWVLWSRASNDLILRLDDDVVLSQDYIKILVQNWTALEESGVNVGALSGIFFTEHVRKRDDHPPVPTINHQPTTVGRRGEVGPGAFMQEYSDNNLIEAEHLYSSCLYSKSAMQQVGGWPLTYSRDVSYHEETDGTFRLHLAGYKLFIVPEAKAIHSHSDTGGTRAMSASRHGEKRARDWSAFQLKVPLLRGVNYTPSVMLYSDHVTAPGGGKKLTFDMDEMLKSFDSDGFIEYMGMLDHNGMDGLRDPDNAVDVLISIGHTPPPTECRPWFRNHVHYSFFPIVTGDTLPEIVTRYVAISKFSTDAVRMIFHRDCECIYPFVGSPVDPATVEKENIVLAVGRKDKGIHALINAWHDLIARYPEGYERPRMVIVSPAYNEDIDHTAKSRSDIEYLWGISEEELEEIYSKAKVLWAGRGFMAPADADASKYAEHFGYTPIEALRHYCVPVAYNGGGYRETTSVLFDTAEELIAETVLLLTDRAMWLKALDTNLQLLPLFERSAFYNDWKRVILSTNAFAWQRHVEWRSIKSSSVSAENQYLNVACIGDHPALNTGFGVAMRETLKGLEEDFKVHVYGFNDYRPDLDGEYASLWPHPRTYAGKSAINDFLRHRPFDAAYICWDPANTAKFANIIRATPGRRIPIVSYTSQEGFPIADEWKYIVASVDKPIVFSKTVSDIVYGKFGSRLDHAYLGADHADFRRYARADRNALRGALGIDDRFVVICVASNVRHKRIAALIDAISMLGDVVLILRTSGDGTDGGKHGVNVRKRAVLRGIEDSVRLVPESPRGIPYETDLEEILRNAPDGPMQRYDWSRTLGMIDWYNVADLYVDMSGAEGWGLPAFEALACGLRVISVDDGFVRSEVLKCPAARLIKPSYTCEWIGNADLQMVDVTNVADAIYELQHGGELARESVAHASKFSWDAARKKIRKALLEVCE